MNESLLNYDTLLHPLNFRQGALRKGNIMRSNAADNNLRKIIFSSLMIALSVIFGYIATIDFTPSFRVSLANVPVMFTGLTLGPFLGFSVGVITDVLNFVLKPAGPFHLGFTLTNGMYGLIPGLFFIYYKKKDKSIKGIKNIALAITVTEIIGSVILYTYFLSSLYGNGFFVMLPIRALKGGIMAVIQTFVLYILLKTTEKINFLR